MEFLPYGMRLIGISNHKHSAQDFRIKGIMGHDEYKTRGRTCLSCE